MRTTLDLDETVLAAAKSLARAKGVSVGRALSEIAMRGLNPQGGEHASSFVKTDYSPFPVIHGDVLVTDELVAEHRDE